MCRHVCDERWHNITRSIRLRGAMALAAQEALRQPTWCTLPPDKFAPLVERASRAYPENILFVYKVCPTVTPLLFLYIIEGSVHLGSYLRSWLKVHGDMVC